MYSDFEIFCEKALGHRIYAPGDCVELRIFNHPDHKTGVIKEVITNQNGTYYRVTRADGKDIDIDSYEDDVRLTPRSAYSYARKAGLDYIHSIKFLRKTYDLTLQEAKEVIADELKTTAEEIQNRLNEELEWVLR